MSNMQEFISRLEAATGPDYEIDLDIARMQGITVMQHNIETGGNDEVTFRRYTAKIDDALTLVPEGWTEGELQWWKCQAGDRLSWCSIEGDGEESLMSVEARGKTPAIAICIAALKARMVQ